MRKTARLIPADRRRFLRHCVLLGGSATLGAGVAGAMPQPADTRTSSPDPRPPGYRLTDHIRRYYETADS